MVSSDLTCILIEPVQVDGRATARKLPRFSDWVAVTARTGCWRFFSGMTRLTKQEKLLKQHAMGEGGGKIQIFTDRLRDAFARFGALEESIGGWAAGGGGYCIPRFVVGDSDEVDQLRIGIFGLIHGDEEKVVAGVFDILKRAEHCADIFKGFQLFFYPLCNPTGYEDGTRETRRGRDINRHFWRHSVEPEVMLLEREISDRHFHGIVALHSDCDAQGIYGFAKGPTISKELLIPALSKAGEILPVSSDNVIDGFKVENGVIQEGYEGVLSAKGGCGSPFEIVFETPGWESEAAQGRAAGAALEAILTNYRAMAAFASGI